MKSILIGQLQHLDLDLDLEVDLDVDLDLGFVPAQLCGFLVS
jgi:hypothetical protein